MSGLQEASAQRFEGGSECDSTQGSETDHDRGPNLGTQRANQKQSTKRRRRQDPTAPAERKRGGRSGRNGRSGAARRGAQVRRGWAGRGRVQAARPYAEGGGGRSSGEWGEELRGGWGAAPGSRGAERERASARGRWDCRPCARVDFRLCRLTCQPGSGAGPLPTSKPDSHPCRSRALLAVLLSLPLALFPGVRPRPGRRTALLQTGSALKAAALHFLSQPVPVTLTCLSTLGAGL